MIIEIPSKFKPSQTYLKVIIRSRKVVSISSRLDRVEEYYSKNIFNKFDFSFFSDRGYHEVRGEVDTPLSNLITLLAYEEVYYHRNVNMTFDDIFDVIFYIKYKVKYFQYR